MARFLMSAFVVLTNRTDPNGSATGLLAVRRDFMRGQACHAANRTIKGNCTPEQIAALQRVSAAAHAP